ncbi:MAG: hypothetical protein ACJA1C_000621 [Crocinitomicaceae bacterium]|jgi:hypothetical protein
MRMEKSELEGFYLERRKEGMDISDIRKELKSRSIDPEHISDIIRFVDDQTLAKRKTKPKQSNILSTKLWAGALVFGGAGIMILTYFRVINLGNMFIIPTGPILYGLFLYRRAGLRKKVEDTPRFGRFRRF